MSARASTGLSKDTDEFLKSLLADPALPCATRDALLRGKTQTTPAPQKAKPKKLRPAAPTPGKGKRTHIEIDEAEYRPDPTCMHPTKDMQQEKDKYIRMNEAKSRGMALALQETSRATHGKPSARNNSSGVAACLEEYY